MNAPPPPRQPPQVPSPFHLHPRWIAILTALFVVSLCLRLYGGLTFGFGMDGPGSFSMINYDEGNSCEGKLGYMRYPTFVGTQIIAIARAFGYPPPEGLNPVAARAAEASDRNRFAADTMKASGYCESAPLIVIERVYSAVTGALTVVLVGLLGLMMWPARPQIAWTAATLLAVSNFHIAESHSATVDAPQVFFLLLFTAVVGYAVVSGRRWPLMLSPLLLAWAFLAKWYLFAPAAYACVVPYPRLRGRWWKYVAAALVVLVVGTMAWQWRAVWQILYDRHYLYWGDDTGPFGTDYGHIGTWRRWIRNLIDLPVVHVMAFGLPACLFVWRGVRRALETREAKDLWLAQTPAFAYALYMLVLGPVTYYRHYLPLFPTVALLAAYGFWESRWATKQLAVALFCLYPLLLTADSEYNYRNDPRRALRPWYQAHPGVRAFVSYYVVPPPAGTSMLFDVGTYLRQGKQYLDRADYLILSENWYDTAFPSELNGPIAWNPEWLIKTRPEFAVAYRRILAGEDPNLQLETEIDLSPFTPEFIVHRYFYGSFQLFIGDLKIFRVVR